MPEGFIRVSSVDAAETYDKGLVDFLRNNAFLSNRYRLLYVSTPKVACTSLKWWFAALEGHAQTLRGLGDTRESDLDLLIHDNFYKVAPNVTGLSMKVLAEPLESDSFFRFALTRNPYKRVFSAWQSKLLLREPLQIDPYVRSDFFYHPIDSRDDIALAFERFLEHVSANEAPSFWDQHWTPQTMLLRPGEVRYSLVAKIEKPRELSDALAKWSNGTLPDPMAVPRKNESLIPYLPEFLTPRSAEMIRSLYADDFRVFDYDVEPPPAKEAFDDGQLDVAIKAVKLIRARHERLGARAVQVEELRKAVAERDTRVADLNQVVAGHDVEIAEREARLADLDRTLVDRDGELTGLRDAIVRISVDVAALESALAERDARIAEQDASVAKASQESKALRDAVAQRDAVVGQLETTIRDLLKDADSWRDGTSQSAAERDKHLQLLAESAHHVRDKDMQIHVLQQQLAAVLASRSWRVAAPLRAVSTLGRRAVSAPTRLQRRFAALSPRARSAIRAIRESELFDAEWYRLTNPDVALTGIDPATHYFLYGWRERRDPSPRFDTAAYLAANPDVDASGANPLAHYLRHGLREQRPLPLPNDAHGAGNRHAELDYDHDGDKASDRQSAAGESLGDPASVGMIGRGVALATKALARLRVTLDPAQIAAEVEVIRKSGLFDEAYYLSMNRDIDPPPADPIRHYCEKGWREGRNPSDEFDTRFYLDTYLDIRDAGLNPLWHYAIAGANEGRDSLPNTSARYEDDIRFGGIETDIQLLAFYASPDWTALKRGKALFKGHAQPRKPIPGLGEYGLPDAQTLERQAKLADSHGLKGFCFDLSGSAPFDGQPAGRMHAAAGIDFHFCVRVDVSAETDVDALVSHVLRLIPDRRYVRVDGQPVLLVKASRDLSGVSARIATVRDAVQERHGAPLFLVGQGVVADAAPDAVVYDAVLDLPSEPIPGETGDYAPVEKSGVGAVPYGVVVSNAIGRIETSPEGSPTTFRCVTLARDTTVMRTEAPLVYTRFHFHEYRRWLDAAMAEARARQPEDRRFVFVNAWNDWNQALHLEPDAVNGFILLNETTRALAGIEPGLKMPRVSVIVPNYNHEAYLRQRLDSIYRQTYRNIDVILLDDCSSDGSRAIMAEYAVVHDDITRVLFNEANSGGPFRQWAKGIQAATGELIWIAESDDYCDSRFLETLVRCFDDEAVLLAYGKSEFVDREGNPLSKGNRFEDHVADIEGRDRWSAAYAASAHHEVAAALGIKNTIPNVSAAVFRRPVDSALLRDESWLSMRVTGDWVFYLHLLRGGKIAYQPDAINFFRRYPGSTAERTYRTELFYREFGMASRAVASLYDVSIRTLEKCRDGCEKLYWWNIPKGSAAEFDSWYDYESIVDARRTRIPNIMVCTMGFYPGGAEILPIRMANEMKRQGHSVVLFSTGLNNRHDGVRKMVRNDVPVVEGRSPEAMRDAIEQFGIEVLNTHQWHVQKYPIDVPEVFGNLRSHVASLHGMIEHGDAFEVTVDQLKAADRNVTDWVYTADKNIEPFRKLGLLDETSGRFIKLPNGMEPPAFVPVSRARLDIPEDAFVLCCVSRAIPDKGWREMIDAVALAREMSGKDIRLLLVGNGPVYDEYCRTGVPAFVHLTGFSADSVGHYAAADMGIMLTRFKSESFPLTIVDCLFAGKPYVASDVGDIRNMLSVGDDIAGAVIELEDWEVPIEKAARVIAGFADGGTAYRDAVALVEKAARRFRIDEVVSRYVELFMAGRQRRKIGDRTRNP